ncbi:MAG: HAMP domain-containing protein, partial [Alphaproteobacteria bacterium]|nr:HAMP domain-containing protein [Alphaproteobacteria bacterium]
ELAAATLELDDLVGVKLVETATAFADASRAVREAQRKVLDEMEGETRTRIASSQTQSGIAALIAMVAGLAVASFIARGIVGPVRAMTGAMARLAGGDNAVEVPARDSTDEIGEMAQAVQIFKENAIKVVRMTAEQEEAKLRAAAEQRRAMTKMADDFEASVKGVVQTVASAATQMNDNAEAMSSVAEETNRQSTAVAAAADEASSNVQTVASAAEELSSSISEISRQVAQAAQVSTQAVEQAERTNQIVTSLADTAQRIGEVVGLINDIASQTNLLALNATL